MRSVRGVPAWKSHVLDEGILWSIGFRCNALFVSSSCAIDIASTLALGTSSHCDAI